MCLQIYGGDRPQKQLDQGVSCFHLCSDFLVTSFDSPTPTPRCFF